MVIVPLEAPNEMVLSPTPSEPVNILPIGRLPTVTSIQRQLLDYQICRGQQFVLPVPDQLHLDSTPTFFTLGSYGGSTIPRIEHVINRIITC